VQFYQCESKWANREALIFHSAWFFHSALSFHLALFFHSEWFFHSAWFFRSAWFFHCRGFGCFVFLKVIDTWVLPVPYPDHCHQRKTKACRRQKVPGLAYFVEENLGVQSGHGVPTFPAGNHSATLKMPPCGGSKADVSTIPSHPASSIYWWI
jgi:hypothetical protein